VDVLILKGFAVNDEAIPVVEVDFPGVPGKGTFWRGAGGLRWVVGL
jgi:hypothetical protein